MNKFKFIRIKYPGVIAITPGIWIKFNDSEKRFAFFVQQISKGLTVHDPNNHIVRGDKEKGDKIKYWLKKNIEGFNMPTFTIKQNGENKNILFCSISEQNPESARTFQEKPYTEILILVEGHEIQLSPENVKYYLKNIFIRYNSTVLNSSLLIPEESYLQESIGILECSFEHEKTFDEITKSAFDWNLPFTHANIFLSRSKYGILPPEKKYLKNGQELIEIPNDYKDVFELFSLGIMQLNQFGNFKLALLESFVAVEVLITRIVEEKKKSKGVSNSKLKEYSKSIDLSYIMDVELKLFFSFDKKELDLIGKMTRARSIRNMIMHKNQVAERGEVTSLIKDIRSFLFMLISKNEKSRN